MSDVRGSNRAVQEYADELRRAEHELEMAQQQVETLRRKAAGPPYQATCCWRWEWGQDHWSHWGWRLLATCGLEWDAEWGWVGCLHEHHADDPAPLPMA